MKNLRYLLTIFPLFWLTSVHGQEPNLIQGLNLDEEIRISRNSGNPETIPFTATTAVMMIMKSSRGTTVEIQDTQGKVKPEIAGKKELIPLQKGAYTLVIHSGEQAENGVILEAVPIPEVEPDSEVMLSFSDSDPSISAISFTVENAGDYRLEITVKRVGKPSFVGYNLCPEDEARNVYRGYRPNYSSRMEDGVKISTIRMGRARLTPGRYYLSFLNNSGAPRGESVVKVTSSFDPSSR